MRTAPSLALLILCGCAGCAPEESGLGQATASRKVVEEFASILNRNIPEFRKIRDPRGFYVADGRPVNFFVFNLADTTNGFPRRPDDLAARVYSNTNPFAVNQRGIYHFAPLDFSISFSHIGVLDNGDLRVFSFVNCEGRGESVSDVVEYLAQVGGYGDTVIARVQNYRSFGTYFQVDEMDSEVRCR